MKKSKSHVDTLFRGLSNVYRGHQAGMQQGRRLPYNVSTSTLDEGKGRNVSKRRPQAT